MCGPLAVVFLFSVCVFSFASPPLIEKIQKETGLPVTISQKEEIASLSQAKHAALTEARDILIKQLSQILSLPETSIRKELFSEMGTPRADLDPVTGGKLEMLLGREMTRTEYELVDMAFKAWKDKEKAIYFDYSGEVANLVDLPQDTVQHLISR